MKVRVRRGEMLHSALAWREREGKREMDRKKERKGGEEGDIY